MATALLGISYDAFENVTSDKTAAPFGYSGEYTDFETGYIYLGNRYYDPDKGKSISEDPICDGLNYIQQYKTAEVKDGIKQKPPISARKTRKNTALLLRGGGKFSAIGWDSVVI